MDRYRIAVELYISSIRALEQRSSAFFIMQSFLVAGYVGLLIQDKNELNIFMAGILAIGIITCVSFFIAGRTTSIDASVWRSYMRMLDSKEANTKETNELPWGYYDKNYSKRADCITKTALGKLPGPTLWLWSPSVFFAAWICGLIVLLSSWHWIYLIVPATILIVVAVYYLYGTQIKDT